MTAVAPRIYYLVTADSRYRLPAETVTEHLRRLAFGRHRRRPTGGVKIIYQHCDLLTEAGYDARPVHLGDFAVDWFDHRCQPLTGPEARRRARPDDILVVPERIPEAAAPYPCRTKLAFVQNGGLVDDALGGKRYEDFGFTGVLCCSPHVSEFMATRTSLPRHTVTNGIRLDLFTPAPEPRRPNTVLYLKRKSSWRLGPEAIRRLPDDVRGGISIIEAPGTCAEAEMVRFYQEADIFMALGFPEGFALPPLEAMACGCAVVGFAGGGGLTHMHDGETALVVRDGDVDGLAQALARLVRDPPLKECLRRGGRAKAQTFGIDAMRRELIAFAGSLPAIRKEAPDMAAGR